MTRPDDDEEPPPDPWAGWESDPDPDSYWSDLDTYPRAPHWRRIETVELPPEDQS